MDFFFIQSIRLRNLNIRHVIFRELIITGFPESSPNLILSCSKSGVDLCSEQCGVITATLLLQVVHAEASQHNTSEPLARRRRLPPILTILRGIDGDCAGTAIFEELQVSTRTLLLLVYRV